MANTYSQLYYHVVFVVRMRANLISTVWKEELFKYITGIVTHKGQKLMCINGMPDHIHILLGIKPEIALSDLMRDIKANSSRFINEQNWIVGRFEWQKGFGAFTVGYSQVDMVFNYIKNQELHHYKKTFREEYIEFLNENGIDYNLEYIFDEV